MKASFWSVLLLLACATVQAQKLYPLRILQDSAVFKLAFQEGRLMLAWAGQAPVWQTKSDFPVLRQIGLEESDLVIQYAPGKAPAQLSYTINAYIRKQNGERILSVTTNEGAVRNADEKAPLRQWVWQDAVESLLEPGETYTLFVTRSLMGAVNCTGDRPVFTLKKQIPYYGVAVAGLTSTAIGLYQLNRSNSEYDAYRQYWSDERSQEEAQPLFDKAENLRSNGRILLYSGLGVTAVDAVLFFLKNRKIKARQRLYDSFCGNNSLGLQIRPQVVPLSSGSTSVGLGMRLRIAGRRDSR
jgi:hypothetical protein